MAEGKARRPTTDSFVPISKRPQVGPDFGLKVEKVTAYLASVQLSENASALVLNGLPSRSRFLGRPAASMPLRDRRAPSAGHEHRAHAVAAPRYKIGLRVNEERIADVVPCGRDFFARHRRQSRAELRYFTFCSIGLRVSLDAQLSNSAAAELDSVTAPLPTPVDSNALQVPCPAAPANCGG